VFSFVYKRASSLIIYANRCKLPSRFPLERMTQEREWLSSPPILETPPGKKLLINEQFTSWSSRPFPRPRCCCGGRSQEIWRADRGRSGQDIDKHCLYIINIPNGQIHHSFSAIRMVLWEMLSVSRRLSIPSSESSILPACWKF
jgi:hypothetical protein